MGKPIIFRHDDIIIIDYILTNSEKVYTYTNNELTFTLENAYTVAREYIKSMLTRTDKENGDVKKIFFKIKKKDSGEVYTVSEHVFFSDMGVFLEASETDNIKFETLEDKINILLNLSLKENFLKYEKVNAVYLPKHYLKFELCAKTDIIGEEILYVIGAGTILDPNDENIHSADITFPLEDKIFTYIELNQFLSTLAVKFRKILSDAYTLLEEMREKGVDMEHYPLNETNTHFGRISKCYKDIYGNEHTVWSHRLNVEIFLEEDRTEYKDVYDTLIVLD